MIKNLLIGDTNYPHKPSLVEILREDRSRSKFGSASNIIVELETLISLAADRIEQLEHELAAIKTQFERYENSDFEQYDCMLEYANFKELIDAIQEEK